MPGEGWQNRFCGELFIGNRSRDIGNRTANTGWEGELQQTVEMGKQREARAQHDSYSTSACWDSLCWGHFVSFWLLFPKRLLRKA